MGPLFFAGGSASSEDELDEESEESEEVSEETETESSESDFTFFPAAAGARFKSGLSAKGLMLVSLGTGFPRNSSIVF